jgi:hypothetical protein
MTIAVVLCALGLVTTGQRAAPPASAVAAVTHLYQDYAAEAVIDSPELSVEDLFGRPKATLARYLDDALVTLVLADHDCSKRRQEVCNLDFSPMWDSQDPLGTTVKISAGKDPTRVLVELQTTDRKEVRRLTYRMIKRPAGWRVHDIDYDSHESLVTMLRRTPGRN